MTASSPPGPPPALPPLRERLRARILADGPITFAAFMREALYDPQEGFYARPPVGAEGHFVTSPHVSPVFATLLARLLEDIWRRLGGPRPFSLVEAGAGDGTLAGRIFENLEPEVLRSLRYLGAEPSAIARGQIERRTAGAGVPAEVVPDIDRFPRACASGCVLANELLDNLPFHRVRRTSDGVSEVFVGLDGDAFAFLDAPASSDAVARWGDRLPPGHDGIAPLAALDFVDRAADVLRRGYVLIIDYAASGHLARDLTVHGYRAQRVVADVLDRPGTTDITAGIDFESLVARARARGLQTWGPRSQRDVLMSLGFRAWDEAARAEQGRATDSRRGVGAARIYSERNAARELIDPAGLGALQVLCLGVDVDVDEAPLGFIARDDRAEPRRPSPA